MIKLAMVRVQERLHARGNPRTHARTQACTHARIHEHAHDALTNDTPAHVPRMQSRRGGDEPQPMRTEAEWVEVPGEVDV